MLEGFDSLSFPTDHGEQQVFCRDSSPAVVVIHEIRDITPEVASFAKRVTAETFRVYPISTGSHAHLIPYSPPTSWTKRDIPRGRR